MNIGSADAHMGNPNVDVCLFPPLRFELLPYHIALSSRHVLADPALEFIVERHDGAQLVSQKRYFRVLVGDEETANDYR